LKTLSETYSVLRSCLNRRKDEIRALDWDIVLTEDAAKAYQGDRKAMRDFGERRAEALKFFKRPDTDYDDFGSWLYALAEQLFVYDAVSVYMCPKKGQGLGRGLLGSDLDEVWLIDGSSIRPLAGLHGERPRPPAVSYQQYEFGVPRADLTVIEAGLDLDGSEGRLRANLTRIDVRAGLRAMLRGDQLSYRPYFRRTDSPHGFSLVEEALIPIMTGLRKQAMQLDFFNESSVPRVWLSPGDSTMTPNQIRELQDAINSIAGDIAWAFKVMVVPPNSKIIPQKDIQIVDDSDNWIATEVAMVCDVTPVELGLLPKVSAAASPFAAREMAQAARSIHERTATKPTLAYLAALPDMILQVICGQPDMRFIFSGMEQTQDTAAITDMGIKQAQSAIKSIDEVRGDLHLPPWGLPETSGPVVFTQLGPVPLGQASSDTVSQQQEALTGAHEAARGQARQAITGNTPPRRALPAGTSGQGRMNGPVTQRQARRGGALAPAHATAEGAPGHSGGKPAPKAAMAELEALGRHLRKGMPAAEWVPVHLPGEVMAIIAEDLGKGLSADYVIRAAIGSLPKTSPPSQQAQRQQMARLAAQYQAQVQAAFSSAITQAQGLIAAWIAGTLSVTAAVLAGMIADLIQAALLAVLTALWSAAWQAGAKAAERETGKPAPGSQAALEAFLATHGANWADLISGTGIAALLAAITQALRAGDAASVTGRLWAILDAEQRSEMIAASEVSRAWNAAYFDALKAAGIACKIWVTSGLPGTCARCLANAAQGPVPLDQPFKSGDLAPLAHPRCRCHLAAAPAPQPLTGKVLRREVGLNGQETWTETEPEPDYSGGRVFQPHRADGTMEAGGGEPPRWDGSEPDPVAEHAPDTDDDADYGSAEGTGSPPQAYWPAPYMDGWFPSPAGHGTGQPGSSSPGAATGRPPNAAGKGRKAPSAAAFLKGAPKAKPSAVRAVMRQNFPAGALGWVSRIRWAGPAEIPVALIDTANSGEWAARHQQDHVSAIARQMEAGEPVNPVIAVLREGHDHLRMIDGRHRVEAARKLGRPVTAYVGWLDDANQEAAYSTYHEQFHSGDSPHNKSFTAGATGDGAAHGLVPVSFGGIALPVAAGLAVRAADTGRILMLQRAHDPADPAAGLFEFPGGCLEPGETPMAAAVREWQE